jgi:hypothetical protein
MEKIASGDQKEEVSCRICLDNEGAVYRVCDCQGGLGYMHMDCLQRWLQEKTNDRTANCEICKKPFKIRKARRLVFTMHISNFKNNINSIIIILYFFYPNYFCAHKKSRICEFVVPSMLVLIILCH